MSGKAKRSKKDVPFGFRCHFCQHPVRGGSVQKARRFRFRGRDGRVPHIADILAEYGGWPRASVYPQPIRRRHIKDARRIIELFTEVTSAAR